MENFLKYELGNEFADVLIYLNESGNGGLVGCSGGHSSHQQPQQQFTPIPAHMCILAARCAYFEAYFRSFLPKDRKIMVFFIIISYSLLSSNSFTLIIIKSRSK